MTIRIPITMVKGIWGGAASTRLPLALALTALLASCAPVQTETADADAGAATPAASAEPAAAGAAPAPAATSESAEELAVRDAQLASAESVIYYGNDQQIRMPAARPPVRMVGEDVSLNFEAAPLEEVVHAIVGDILQLDYVIDHPIKGQVTLRTRAPVARDQLLGILESLLEANKVLMLRGKDGRYLISGSPQLTSLVPSVSNPANSDAGYSTVIVPLQFIGAAEMRNILQPLATERAFVRVDARRNLLMLAGTREQLNGWQDIIATFDVDLMAGMSVGLFPLENTSVEEIEAIIGQMLGREAGGADASQLARVIPVERLNSIIVVTPRAHYLKSIETWIERLDGEPNAMFTKRLYVYPVQNTTAERLASLLTSIYAGDGGGPGRGVGNQRAGVAPGMTRETISGGGSIGGGSGSSSLGSGRSAATGSGGTGASGGGNRSAGVSGSFGSRNDGGGGRMTATSISSGGGDSPMEDVRVVADDENNALMIYATGKQYEIIEAALKQLDIVATQVIIEASILEVTLEDDLQYGLEWFFKNGLGDSYDGQGSFGTPNASALFSTGFQYTVTNSVGDISAVLTALSNERLLNVISTPSVMVLDNQTAFIQVGDSVPIIDQQTTSDASNTGRITQSVTYRDTGVQLTVRPSVNAGGLITMDIEQSVTDVGNIDEATNQRSFLERNISSRIAVRSTESIVLGGLIRETARESERGVPVLHKIPVMG
ncbi:MAG: type II secretion system secretin GspD, partial [Pseudomonadota bacterium]